MNAFFWENATSYLFYLLLSRSKTSEPAVEWGAGTMVHSRKGMAAYSGLPDLCLSVEPQPYKPGQEQSGLSVFSVAWSPG